MADMIEPQFMSLLTFIVACVIAEIVCVYILSFAVCLFD